MFNKPLYGSSVAPACAHCAFGAPAADGKMVLCRHRGVVSPYFSCRRYRYDPLQRVPKRRELPHFDPKDFRLDE